MRKGNQITTAPPEATYDMLPPFYSTEYEDLIIKGDEVDIKPSDIDVSGGLMNALGHVENEKVGITLITFAKVKDKWEKFTYPEINEFYKTTIVEPEKYHFCFWGLLLEQYIAYDDEGNYFFTVEFVMNCYRSSQRFVEKSA